MGVPLTSFTQKKIPHTFVDIKIFTLTINLIKKNSSSIFKLNNEVKIFSQQREDEWKKIHNQSILSSLKREEKISLLIGGEKNFHHSWEILTWNY